MQRFEYKKVKFFKAKLRVSDSLIQKIFINFVASSFNDAPLR